MSYTQATKDYLCEMPQEMQKEAQIQIMKLRKKGYSFE